MLNPHPTLIPAIESGLVESVYCFGSELGMERYVSAAPDVFSAGADGNLRSNRRSRQVAGQYAGDLFIGATLQIDGEGNSSTAPKDRITGFGGAPNMGPTRAAGATTRLPGCALARKRAKPCADASSWCKWCRRFSRTAHRASSNGWTRSTSRLPRASRCRR